MKKEPSSPTPTPRKTLKPKTVQPLAAPPTAAKRSTAAPKTRARTAKPSAPAEVLAMPPAPRLVTTNRAPKPTPSADAIAQRAYELFMARNWEHGHRSPQGPARVLLALLDRNPKIVEETLISRVSNGR